MGQNGRRAPRPASQSSLFEYFGGGSCFLCPPDRLSGCHLDAPHSSIQPEPSLELVQLLGGGLIRIIRPCCGSFRSGGPARCGLRLGQRRLRSIAARILIEGILSAKIGSNLSVRARRIQLAGAAKRIALHILLRLEVDQPVIVLICLSFHVLVVLVFPPSIL